MLNQYVAMTDPFFQIIPNAQYHSAAVAKIGMYAECAKYRRDGRESRFRSAMGDKSALPIRLKKMNRNICKSNFPQNTVQKLSINRGVWKNYVKKGDIWPSWSSRKRLSTTERAHSKLNLSRFSRKTYFGDFFSNLARSSKMEMDFGIASE